MSPTENQLNIQAEIEQHHDLMVELDLPDREDYLWLHKRILSLFKCQELDLVGLVEDAVIRFYKPLGTDIIALVEHQQYDTLPKVLDGYQTAVFSLDKLYIIDIVPISTPLSFYSSWYLDELRWLFGPRYPDKIERQSFIVATSDYPNGPKVEYANWSQSDGIFLEAIFKEYNSWFKQHSEKLSLQFQTIAEEIRDWLQSQYKINPNREGFISWFIKRRLGSITFTLTGNINSPIASLNTNFSAIQNIITPKAVENDLHAYCHWKQEQQQILYNKTIKPSSKILTTEVIKEIPNQRTTRPSTLARENRLKELVRNYMELDSLDRIEAMKRAAEKEGCGFDTVERALGLKKR